MKASKIKIAISAVAIVLLAVFTFLLIFGVFEKGPGGGPTGGDDSFYLKGDAKTMYGEDAIFDEALGWANSDPSAIQLDSGERYLYYTSNQTMFSDDYAIVVRKGEKVNGEYQYTGRKTLITPSESGWDAYHVGSADVVKGAFAYNGKTYSYLMAYQANADEFEEKCFEIGLAVAETPDGEWIKVGDKPILTNYATQSGDSVLGYYAPSLVSNDKGGNVKLFYTYGDAYGHFQYFVDLDCSNLNNIPAFGSIVLSGNGLATGEGIVMFPNADFVYDSENERYYVVKDFSPSADTLPRKAYQIELAYVEEYNLYTADLGYSFTSLEVINGFTVMGDRDGWERLYSGTIVSDEFGGKLGSEIEILYNACDIEMNEPEDYLWTPSVHSYIHNEI